MKQNERFKASIRSQVYRYMKFQLLDNMIRWCWLSPCWVPPEGGGVVRPHLQPVTELQILTLAGVGRHWRQPGIRGPVSSELVDDSRKLICSSLVCPS